MHAAALAVLLLSNVNPAVRPEAGPRLSAAAKAHNWQIVYWAPGKSLTPALTGGEVILAGGASDSGKAAKALLSVAAKMRQPLVIRFPRDGVYGEWASMDKLEDPAGFYAKHIIPDWLPPAGDLPANTSLRVDVLDHGRPHTVYAIGTGHETKVIIDITDLKSLDHALAAAPAKSAVPPPSVLRPLSLLPKEFGDARIPGSPLDTREAQGLFFGKGDRGNSAAGWASAQHGPGGLERAHVESYFNGDVPGYARLDHSKLGGVERSVVDVGFTGKTLGADFRFLSQKVGLDTHTLVRAGGRHRSNFGPLRNDASAKVGFLRSQYGLQGGSGSLDHADNQLLFGAGDVVSLGLDLNLLKVTAEAGAEAVWSQMDGKTQWDNTRLHGGLKAVVPLSDSMHLMGQYKHRLLEHNPERYFFAGSRIDDQVLGGLSWSRPGFGAGLMGGVQVIKGEQANDHRRQAGAWVKAFDTTLTALASRGEWTEDLTVALSRKITQEWDLEGYYNRDSSMRYDYKQESIGLRVSWGFGGGAAHSMPDGRRYRPQHDDIYAQRYVQDRKLDYATFSGEMDSVRKANEFAGKNLTWVTGDANKLARTPTETYGGRAGDCDEQAWLVSRALNDNRDFAARGGKAYILDYWTGNGGHGVSLVEENGKVFVNEYGRTYRINVDPKASMEEKARAALQQAGRHLALKPSGKDPVMYAVFGTKDSGTAATYFTNNNEASNWVVLDGLQTEAGRPPVETGVNALLGADSF